MDNNKNNSIPLEKEYPILIDTDGFHRLVINNKYLNGFYLEMWVIEYPGGGGYMFTAIQSPYEALVRDKWRQMQAARPKRKV